MSRRAGLLLSGLIGLAAISCREGRSGPLASGAGEDEEGVFCNIPLEDLAGILGPDQIPALTDPTFVAPDAAEADYLTDSSRVVGLVLDGEALAVPLNILLHHEIVNLNRGEARVAVTYCPLTGSSLTFDRSAVAGAEFGVSGILMRNNLVLFDRSDEWSFFPQMSRRAACGPLARVGRVLPMVASAEMRWDAWIRLYPETRVVSRETGFGRAYHLNPNAEYERIDNPDRLIPVPLDPRRPPKERVFGVPLGGDGGPAFPFEAMRAHARLALPIHRLGRPGVVFWDRTAEGALAFFVDLDGADLTFDVTDEGYRDQKTGSMWRLDGLAVSGPLVGRRLEPLAEAYVAFWFAWADFQPETVVWQR